MRSIKKLQASCLLLVLIFALTGCGLLPANGKNEKPDTDSITAAMEEQRQAMEEAKKAQKEAHEANASQKPSSDPDAAEPSADSSADSAAAEEENSPEDDSSSPENDVSVEESSSEGDKAPVEESSNDNSAPEESPSTPPVHDPKVEDSTPTPSMTYREAYELYAPIIEAAGTVYSSAGASDEAAMAAFDEANRIFETEDCLGFYDFFIAPGAPNPKYVIADVDKNGSLELMLLAGDDSGIVLSMFTLVDGTPCHVFCSWSRSNYSFTETGDFLYKGSSGAADSVAAIYSYRLGEMLLVESARSESSHHDPDGNIVSEFRFFDELPNESIQITEEEFYELYDAISSAPVMTADEVVAYFAP